MASWEDEEEEEEEEEGGGGGERRKKKKRRRGYEKTLVLVVRQFKRWSLKTVSLKSATFFMQFTLIVFNIYETRLGPGLTLTTLLFFWSLFSVFNLKSLI